MTTRATATKEKRSRLQQQRNLAVRRQLDAQAQIEGMIDFDKDIPAWEDLIIEDHAAEMSLPFWRVLQGFKALALENASLRRMLRN